MTPTAAPSVLRDISFRTYFKATAVSAFGDAVSLVAIPLTAATTLAATPAEMGYLTALPWLPFVVLSIYAGYLTDWIGRRRTIMIASDIMRFLLYASVPASYALGTLTLVQLYVVVLVAGICAVFFTVSDASVLGTLIPGRRYVPAQSALYGGQSAAMLAGPSVGGVLVQLLTAPISLLVDAASFLYSALQLRKIRMTEAPAQRGESGSKVAGLRFIRRSSLLRALLATTTMTNFFRLMLNAVLLTFLAGTLQLSPTAIGIILGAEAVGAVLGSLLIHRLASRVGTTLLYGALLGSCPLAIMPMATGPTLGSVVLLVVVVVVSGAGQSAQDISVASIFTAVVPAETRSRVKGRPRTRQRACPLSGVTDFTTHRSRLPKTAVTTALYARIGGECL